MEDVVTRRHATYEIAMYCLYGYYNLGLSKQHLAFVYQKDRRTLNNWIKQSEETGTFERGRSDPEATFSPAHRQWLCDFYRAHPLAYLDEAKNVFEAAQGIAISKTSVWRIIHDHGMTWKVLERRAMHVKESDIFRFMQELSHINWCYHNLVFLDESSFDDRGMLRKRGYSIKGQKLAIRGDFKRKPRVSVLAFLGVTGVIDVFDTEGTFDRLKFFECCKDFAYSTRGGVHRYPGPNSVWILDGASIHRDPEIVNSLRSIGIVVIFLPAYCPFFNPIEYLFGYVKSYFQRHYDESSGNDLLPFVARAFCHFETFDMTRVFSRCGWKIHGCFDPTEVLAREQQRRPVQAARLGRAQGTDMEDELGFREATR